MWKPTQSLPVRTGARSFDSLGAVSHGGGWVLSDTLTSGVHRTPRIKFLCSPLMMLIHNPTLIRRCERAEVRACVGAARSPAERFPLTCLFFTHAFRDLDAGRGGGGGRLIAHSCVEGVLWAPELLDKVQGLVYTKPANRLRRQRTSTHKPSSPAVGCNSTSN